MQECPLRRSLCPLPFLQLHTQLRSHGTVGSGEEWPRGIAVGPRSRLAWPRRARSSRTGVSVPFRASSHDLSFSQHSASGWWLTLLTSRLEARLGPSVSAQLHRRAFSAGSAGVHCHLAILLSVFEVGSLQFLKSWLIFIVDQPFSLCIWVEHWVRASLPWAGGHSVLYNWRSYWLFLQEQVGRALPPPGTLSGALPATHAGTWRQPQRSAGLSSCVCAALNHLTDDILRDPVLSERVRLQPELYILVT